MIKSILLFLLLGIGFTQSSLGQSSYQTGTSIAVKILSCDSTSKLAEYNIYTFIGSTNSSQEQGRFLILKSRDSFAINQEVEIKLCRVIELENDGINLRGCSLMNGIRKDGESYNFNPEWVNPIFSVCDK